MTYITAYLVTAFVFFGLDLIWLGLLARRFYATALADFLRERPNFALSALFYAGYVAAIVFFAEVRAESLPEALGTGFLLGLTAYGTYNLTNMATLKGWPARVSFADMAWGSSLTALAAGAGFMVI